MNWPILSVVTFLPLLGALFITMVRGNDTLAKNTSRWVAMWTTLVTFAISLVMVVRFDPTSAEFQFTENHPWLGVANYHMGCLSWKKGDRNSAVAFFEKALSIVPGDARFTDTLAKAKSLPLSESICIVTIGVSPDQL